MALAVLSNLRKPQNVVHKYMFNYNVLESCMLCSALALLLAGLIFDSAQFRDGTAAHWSLTIFVLVLIASSSAFIFSCFFKSFRAIFLENNRPRVFYQFSFLFFFII